MKTPLVVVLSVVLVAAVISGNQLGAQTTVTPPTSTGTPSGGTGIANVQNIVEITRTVPVGVAAVDAFTVPTGALLVITDVIMTNTGTAAACGGAVNRAATAVATTPTTSTGATGTPTDTSTSPTLTVPPPTSITPPPTTIIGPTIGVNATTSVPGATVVTSTGTVTQTDSTVTGPLCVPAQTTTTLALTTGIEFGSGQIVQLLNARAATASPGAPPTTESSLVFHLRGVLLMLS